MLAYILGALLVAWFLGLFGFDGLMIEGLQQLFGISIGLSGYYMLFVLTWVVIGIIHAIKRKAVRSEMDDQGR